MGIAKLHWWTEPTAIEGWKMEDAPVPLIGISAFSSAFDSDLVFFLILRYEGNSLLIPPNAS